MGTAEPERDRAGASQRGSPPWRHAVPALALALLATAGWTLCDTVATGWSNHHFAHGMQRATLYLYADGVESRLPLLVALALGVGTLAAVAARSTLAGVLAAGAALGTALLLNAEHIGMDVADWWRLPALLARRGFRIGLGESAAALGVGALLLVSLAHPVLRRALARALGHAAWRDPRVLAALAATVALPWGAARWLRAIETRGLPNIVLVSLDTLRADHLGVYGYARPTSPAIDRLAAESHVFDWAISQAPYTLPSHMSLLTSLYPSVHGVLGREDALPGERITLAEYLLARGYRTAAITDAGFVRAHFGFGQGFQRFDEWRRSIADAVPLALSWLHGSAGDPPFFLFLHSYEVHSPYEAPAPFAGTFADPDYDGGFEPIPSRLEAVRQAVRDGPPGTTHGLTAADVAFLTDRYDEGILHADHWIGRLVEGLAARGLLEETWLILLSDHGEEFTEHGSVHHEKLYHTVTRVPLVLRPPGGADGRRIERVVELIDVTPTLLEIAGVTPRAPLQGRSLLPLLRGDDGDWRDEAYSEFDRYERRRALTTAELHVLTSLAQGELEAYAFRRDPLEQRPLRGSELTRGARAADAALREWIDLQARLARAAPEAGAGAEPSEDTIHELRKLGYVE